MRSNARIANHLGTVYLVDDDAAVLRATSRLLRTKGYDVTTFSSPRAFISQEKLSGPGCLILDLSMPEMTGLDIQELVKRNGQTIPIVFMTGEGSIPDSVRAIQQGAIDFLVKPVRPALLLNTVAKAVETHRLILAEMSKSGAWRGLFDTLTPRERQVCLLVAQGLLNKQIAGDLNIAERTVKTHRARVMAKLGLRSVADIVRFLESIEVRFPDLEFREPTRAF